MGARLRTPKLRDLGIGHFAMGASQWPVFEQRLWRHVIGDAAAVRYAGHFGISRFVMACARIVGIHDAGALHCGGY